MYCGHRQENKGEGLKVQNKQIRYNTPGVCVADELLCFWKAAKPGPFMIFLLPAPLETGV